MAYNQFQRDIFVEIWRADWFRIEYAGDRMLERVSYITDLLKPAAAGRTIII